MAENTNIIKEFDGTLTKELFNVDAIRKATATKADMRGYAEKLTLIINDAVLDGNFAPFIEIAENETVNAREFLAEAVNGYTAIAREECFKALKATDDPMLEAIKQLTFPTIKAVEKKVGEEKEKIPVMSIEDIEKPIDLLRLDKFCGGIGKDSNWAHIAQKFNYLLTVQKAIDLGLKPNEAVKDYAMSDVARDFDMGKTPTSNTNMLKTLQRVVTAMIGEEYKALSHDVKYLLSVFTKKNNRKVLTVTCANHKNFTMYIAEVCHRIVTDAKYGVEYKTVKK